MTNSKWFARTALTATVLLVAITPIRAQEKKAGRSESIERSAVGPGADKAVQQRHDPGKKDLLPPRTERLDEIAGVPGFASRIMIGRTEVTGRNQYGTAGFFLGETWSEASRVAAKLCGTRGFAAGHFNGHQDGAGTLEVLCSGQGAVWRDAGMHEIGATGFAFVDVNQVSWAQANRAAAHLCAAANQGFAGGHFNGHQLNGNYGLFCYRDGAQWFDATAAELAAAGWSSASPELDDVPWAQAMRAATGFCQARGYDGGFMNGHQLPNKFGVVCQK